MATTSQEVHAQLKKIEVNGSDQKIITVFPVTTSSDVTLTGNTNSNISSLTTVKDVLNKLGSLAFKNSINTMTGATSSGAGTSGLVPAPSAGSNTKFLKGDGTWTSLTTSNITDLQTSLNNYLPLSGGTVTGITTINSELYADSENVGDLVVTGSSRFVNDIIGNINTATKLKTARKLTIGSTGKTFDGSADVSWTLAEIGAAATSHTHNYIPMTGSNSITGGLGINTTNRGYCLTDKTGALYAGIIDNGTNLWIGASYSAGTHHTGSTYISTGYDSGSKAGNGSIYIAIPSYDSDSSTWSQTSYLALHTGNYTDYTVTKTGTGANGTWGISITGNAATATKVSNSLSINGKTYNGSSVVDVGTLGAAYGGTGQTSLNAAAISFINSLTTGTATPNDADYYISQYAGGGTTTTTYHRRPVSSLWAYMAGKIGSAGSETNPVYISSGVAKACTYTLEASVPSNAKFTDTWRGIQDVLTSTSTTDSLSANQGKILNDKIEGLTIGGRNLYSTTTKYYANAAATRDLTINGFQIAANATDQLRLYNIITEAVPYTVSFYAKTGSDTATLTVDICDGTNLKCNLTTTYAYFVLTWTPTKYYDNTSYQFVDFLPSSSNPLIYIKDIKVEKGTRATQWTPAPEDLVYIHSNQNISGHKTFKNYVTISYNGSTAESRLLTRHIDGLTTSNSIGDLYLNYDGGSYARKVYLGGSDDGSIAVCKNMIPSTITIGNTSKSLGGAGTGISFTLDDIGASKNDHNHIIAEKTYTGIYASANNFASATFYFASIVPDDWYKEWHIKYQITAYVPDQGNYNGHFEVELWGSQAGRTIYKCTNAHYSTSYRTLYYHVLYTLTNTGFTNGYGHALGVGLRNSTNPTSSSYPRTFKIQIIEANNCTVSMTDTLQLYSAISGTGSTNYSGYAEYDGCNNGLRESGDDNTIDRLIWASFQAPAGTNGIMQSSLIMQDSSGTWQSLTTTSGTGTSKTKNTVGFRYDKVLFYSGGSNITSGNRTASSAIYSNLPIDFRYSSNCGTTLTAYSSVYLKGTIGTDGLFYLDDTWYTQTLPIEDDGYVYIYIGDSYNTYCIYLSTDKPTYWYKNGAIREYSDDGISLSSTQLSNWNTAYTHATSEHPYLLEKTISTATDFNTITTTGVYHIKFTSGTNQATTNHGTLYVDFTVGTPFQIWEPDNANISYKRTYATSTSTWGSWMKRLYSDTTYSAGTGLSLSSTTFSLATVTRTNNTSTVSPKASGTFNAIDTVTTDSYGRVTAVNLKTVTLPSDSDTVDGFHSLNNTFLYADYKTCNFTTTDNVYVKLTLSGSATYFTGMIRLFVKANYDNIAGTTFIDIYDRAQKLYIRSTSYNYNNLLGVYQPNASTQIFYLKLHGYRASTNSGGTLLSTQGTVTVYSTIGITSIEEVTSDSDDYATVSAYAYTEVLDYGISSGAMWGDIVPRGNNSKSLGSSSIKWKNVYSTTFTGALVGNADTATKLQTARTLTIGNTGKTFDGSSNVSWTFAEMGTDGRYVYDKSSVGSTNMNTVATFGNSIGMAQLNNTDITTPAYVNPNGQTDWHHFINMSFTVSSSNMWQTQIANKAGTTDLWIRSRKGGSVDNDTAWVAPWTRILTGTNWSNVITVSSLGAAASSHTHSYLPLSGGTMTGVLNLKGSMYTDARDGALNLNNSDIFGVNSILFSDNCDSAGEGLQWYRGSDTVDSMWDNNGTFYWTPNRTLGSTGTNYKVLDTNGILYSGNTKVSVEGHTHSYLPLSGGTLTGLLNANGGISIKGGTSSSNAFDSTNPKIQFMNANGDQGCQLVFTDYDAIQAPASLTLVGQAGEEAVYFIAPNIKATSYFYGNLSGTATNATKDSAGQQINTTYIKSISASGKTITVTKGDGTTSTATITESDTLETVTTRGNTTSKEIKSTNGTDSTSSTTGAITTSGGIGATGSISTGGKVNIADSVSLEYDSDEGCLNFIFA